MYRKLKEPEIEQVIIKDMPQKRDVIQAQECLNISQVNKRVRQR